MALGEWLEMFGGATDRVGRDCRWQSTQPVFHGSLSGQDDFVCHLIQRYGIQMDLQHVGWLGKVFALVMTVNMITSTLVCDRSVKLVPGERGRSLGHMEKIISHCFQWSHQMTKIN